jgi:flagellar biosynthetic protein FlhB
LGDGGARLWDRAAGSLEPGEAAARNSLGNGVRFFCRTRMADDQGDKTEEPTQKKLEETFEKGQFARSAEIQTVAVLLAGVAALTASGKHSWDLLSGALGMLGHLHEITLSTNAMQEQFVKVFLVFAACVGPTVLAVLVAGAFTGAAQARFKATPEALGFRPERLNPVEGLKRVFGLKNIVPTAVGVVKLSVILWLSYSVIHEILGHPIFYETVDMERIAGFMGEAALKICLRVIVALGVIAAADYGYQWWKTHKELMMTKQEIKDEAKGSEGNPHVKGKMRRRAAAISKRKMLAEVPTADVIVTNPAHIAVALRYDRKSMKAPKIVAKGTRLNALQIREIAKQHQIPIMENKALARMMFKYGKVGGEIPAQLYSAVAEVLAWVYRVNAYRYYREQNR